MSPHLDYYVVAFGISSVINHRHHFRPYPTSLAPEDLNEVDDAALDNFSSVPMNSMATQETTFIMVSGAGRTGASDLSLLRNVKPSFDTTVTSAFGPAIKPTHTGIFGPHDLDAVYIKSIGPQTLVSLSKFCNAGNHFVGVFTPTEYRMYDLTSALPALDSLAYKGIEAERGTVRNGRLTDRPSSASWSIGVT